MAALDSCDIAIALERVLHHVVKSLHRTRRQQFAVSLVAEGLVSQRQASVITGVSRDTIRKHARSATRGSH